MYLSSNTPQVRISYSGHPFDLIFDTGNVKSDLGNKFAETFPDAIEGSLNRQPPVEVLAEYHKQKQLYYLNSVLKWQVPLLHYIIRKSLKILNPVVGCFPVH